MTVACVRYLSYPYEKTVPAYGNERNIVNIRPVKSIFKGDSSNTYRVSFENHWGTHVDAPAHFFKNGSSITDLSAKTWCFEDPGVVNVKAREGQIIGLKDIERNVSKKNDIVIIKTGFGRFRGEKKYSLYNPGIDPEVAFWIREKRPMVRAIGFDLVSVGSYLNRPLARETHRVFLDPKGKGKPVLLVEDMCLSGSLKGLRRVCAVPICIKGVDSAPCTILGFFNR